MKRKGFTLIELIVVMAIIAILVLFGSPKYLSYSKEARLTKIKVEAKELETASQKYYMVHSDWPRLSDTPYTTEQIENYSKNILDKTGTVVELDINGDYYDIGYDKIKNYIKEPVDKENYILQNPVGNIYYLEGITDEGKNRIPVDKPKFQEVVWNEEDKYENIVLSEGGLKAISPNLVHGSVKSTVGKTSGKWYWEVKVIGDTYSYTSVSVGISDSSEKGMNEGYMSAKSVRYYQSSSVFVLRGNNATTKGYNIRNNDILGLLLDMDNKTIEFRRNNLLLEKIDISPYIDSEAYALLELCGMSALTNFGGTPFVYELPAGYKPYASK